MSLVKHLHMYHRCCKISVNQHLHLGDSRSCSHNNQNNRKLYKCVNEGWDWRTIGRGLSWGKIRVLFVWDPKGNEYYFYFWSKKIEGEMKSAQVKCLMMTLYRKQLREVKKCSIAALPCVSWTWEQCKSGLSTTTQMEMGKINTLFLLLLLYRSEYMLACLTSRLINQFFESKMCTWIKMKL